MNCGCPSAPAQEPRSAAGSTSLLSRIFSAQNSSSRNIVERRGIVGERCQRGDRRPHAAEAAEVRLETPDGDDRSPEGRWYFAAHALQQRRMLLCSRVARSGWSAWSIAAADTDRACARARPGCDRARARRAPAPVRRDARSSVASRDAPRETASARTAASQSVERRLQAAWVRPAPEPSTGTRLHRMARIVARARIGLSIMRPVDERVGSSVWPVRSFRASTNAPRCT